MSEQGTEPETSDSGWRGRTLWVSSGAAPLRSFLQTESGSARVLLAGVVAALLWANLDTGSYEDLWHT